MYVMVMRLLTVIDLPLTVRLKIKKPVRQQAMSIPNVVNPVQVVFRIIATAHL